MLLVVPLNYAIRQIAIHFCPAQQAEMINVLFVCPILFVHVSISCIYIEIHYIKK